ncbi:hypothetical protein WN943_008903 [Citrus x changshan-huyou]
MGYNGSGFSGNERRRSKFQNNSGARAEEASGHVTKTASPRHRMQRNKLSSIVQASRVKTDDPPRGKHHHGLPLSQSRVLMQQAISVILITANHFLSLFRFSLFSESQVSLSIQLKTISYAPSFMIIKSSTPTTPDLSYTLKVSKCHLR